MSSRPMPKLIDRFRILQLRPKNLDKIRRKSIAKQCVVRFYSADGFDALDSLMSLQQLTHQPIFPLLR
ncbi:MAG: 23S rRNA A2030 N6-methylase RlmJ [Planctomycetaceae bacterium]|jgi:23S rRNA A2030 N6-methylase RlmJ